MSEDKMVKLKRSEGHLYRNNDIPRSKMIGVNILKIRYSIIILIFGVSLLISLGLVFAQQSNVCCEKTQSGAWCQNTEPGNCDIGFRQSPTSCESTSFCSLGCCVDTAEGLCMENTPQRVCENDEGTWNNDASCEIAQCDLGCCVLGDQASFVTLTRCKKLSAEFGLDTNFKRDINDEASCIAIAHFQEKGACVFEADGSKTCKFTTREGCINQDFENLTGSTEFYPDKLCSNDELSTDCGPTTKTSCLDGKEEVYFLDSCGNPANIYDSNKVYSNDKDYWQEIKSKEESCGIGSGNVGSKSCGNCEYLKGSICGKGNANVGDYICEDLNCYNTENGEDYKNGESWCVNQGNVREGRDSVGSRHFRHVCINGEEVIEPCADFRSEVCIENEIDTGDDTFIEAACRVNRWDSCIEQTEELDCSNQDRRDCYWFDGLHFVAGSPGEQQSLSESEDSGNIISNVFGGGSSQNQPSTDQVGVANGGNACLPNIPSGFDLSGKDGTAASVCGFGNSQCVVIYEKSLLFGKKCVQNCECLTTGWAENMNNLCTSLGDCGAYVNLVGKFTEGGAEWKVNGGKRVLNGLMNNVKRRAGV